MVKTTGNRALYYRESVGGTALLFFGVNLLIILIFRSL